MSELKLVHSGYVCVPYLHDHSSIDLKESWILSKNIEQLFFATATFSEESKPYFSDSTNHYLIAKFSNSEETIEELNKNLSDKTCFLFSLNDVLFERESGGEMNFISMYYCEYGEDGEDYREIADVLGKREKIDRAGIGSLKTFCKVQPKFIFPYVDNIVALEVSSEKSHQSVNKYCEKTRRDVNRKGLTMTNLMGFSILEQLK